MPQCLSGFVNSDYLLDFFTHDYTLTLLKLGPMEICALGTLLVCHVFIRIYCKTKGIKSTFCVIESVNFRAIHRGVLLAISGNKCMYDTLANNLCYSLIFFKNLN